MDDPISPFLKYVLFVILLLAVVSLMWILRDGISVRNGGQFRQLNSVHPAGVAESSVIMSS